MSIISTLTELKSQSEKPGGERNILDFLIYRNLSTLLLFFIKGTRFSPNFITSSSILFSILAAFCLFNAHVQVFLWIGIVLMNISLVLDTLDGQYSRYTKQQTEFGGWYDGVSDCLKYLFLIGGVSSGIFYNYSHVSDWLISESVFFQNHPEISLILGMVIICNLFMVYYIHATRYQLSFNPGTVVNLSSEKSRYHFGIESTVYTIFTLFLLAQQPFWLLLFLCFALPALWVLPFYLVWSKYRSQR